MKAEIVLQIPHQIYGFVLITKALSSRYGFLGYAVSDDDRIFYDRLSKEDVYSILEYLTSYYTVCVDSATLDNEYIFTFCVREKESSNESAV